MRKTIPILFIAMLLLMSSLELLLPGPRRVYASPGKHRSKVNAIAQQAQVRAHLVNEDVIAHIETMADLHVKYQEKVVQMVDEGKMDPEQGKRLAADLTDTLEELEQRATTSGKSRTPRRGAEEDAGFSTPSEGSSGELGGSSAGL